MVEHLLTSTKCVLSKLAYLRKDQYNYNGIKKVMILNSQIYHNSIISLYSGLVCLLQKSEKDFKCHLILFNLMLIKLSKII